MSELRAPFPWFGGKSRVSEVVWRAFGNVPNYVEPFAGSLAVMLGRPHEPKIETVNDKDCVAPGTRILRADLTWGLAEDIKIGDKLFAFDEQNGPAREGLRAPTRYRRLAEATVTNVRLLRKPAYRLTFDDGTTVVASENHLWLGGSHKTGGRGWRWVKTKNMVCNRKTQRSWVLKVADVVEQEKTFEAGWIGGLLDGEGHLHIGPGVNLGVSQNEGVVLEHAERLLALRGIAFERRRNRKCRVIAMGGGLVTTLSSLMRFRPLRLIDNLRRRLPELSLYGRKHRAVGLVSKEFLGEQTVVAIETDTKTFVAEGLASHNCFVSNFWRAVQAEPETAAKACDWPVNEADLHARHRWLVEQALFKDFREKMLTDPNFYDVTIAGWWVWGISQWIGGGWCHVEGAKARAVRSRSRPDLDGDGQGVHKKMPNTYARGQGNGVHVPPGSPVDWSTTPSLHGRRGIETSPRRPRARSAGVSSDAMVAEHLPSLGNMRGVLGESKPPCLEWFAELQRRLRRVRVCCGDWKRVLGDSVLGTTKSRNSGMNPCGLFLDPPYSDDERDPDLYAQDDGSIAKEVAKWAIAHGDDPDLRIALCGYEGEHEMPETWTKHAWKAHRGYAAADNENVHRERIWFSPHCLPLDPPQLVMFG